MVIKYEKDSKHIVTLSLDQPNHSANLLGQELFDALGATVDRLCDEDALAGVVLTSAKRDFILGGDLDLLFKARDPAWLVHWGMAFKQQLRRLETLGKPVVAAINGTALGGGLEIALACHHRILLNDPRVRVGLPEIKLGLFPGGGGTQRLPRLIGVQAAMPIILEGRELKPQKALEAGIVGELAGSLENLMERARAWILKHPGSAQPWDQKGFRWPGGDPKSPRMAQVWMMAPTMLNQKTRGHYPAASDALAAICEGSLVDFDTASRIESRYFAKTVVSQTAKNMINAFWYQMNQIRRGAARPDGFEKGVVNRVGVLGAGMMGAGIAHVSALAGIDVVLKDVSMEMAEKGRSHSLGLLEKGVARGRMKQDRADAVAGRIHPTDKTEDLAGCDLIIEAVFENRALKATVTREAEECIEPSAIFASNTSTLPITGLADASMRPANFIGLHFFSPVDKMQLVEIIVGKQTSSETLARAFDYVQQIKKVPIVVNDSRGFFTSRVFSTYVQEGMALLDEGMNPAAIESAGLQAGMPVGPLALSDEVSLSLMHHIRSQTRKDMQQEGKPFTVHPGDSVITKMVEVLDRPGKKAGKGFYDYPADGPKHLWPGLGDEWRVSGNQLAQQEMIDRLRYIQAIEAVRCLQEGVINSIADANIGSILGWGFAPFKGGVLQFINDQGLFDFINKAESMATRFGERFRPPELLQKKYEAGEQF